ncbi:diguanylate cyclase [Acinetobacter qingfengensis]|uniref:diguanylate cyclase n=2 Tax=Acinetobacter qingfengensis TaxID=1262585 RepID=A0A1E7RG44_9GAMM|nr:diguanylate cyclase [Acinetobacter qingfengensis]
MLVANFERIFLSHIVIRRCIILLILLLMGIMDYITGIEYSFSIFYLIPVAIASWYDTSKATIVTIITAVIVWLWADYATRHHYSSWVVPVWNSLVRVIFFFIVASLIIKVRKNWLEMKTMAMKDQLTDIDNLCALELEYRVLRKISLRKNISFAIAMIDLDGFKAVNDTYGHQQGDTVLITFAKILKRVNRASDTVGRLGGDEFVVMFLNIDGVAIHKYDERLRLFFDKSELKQKFGVDYSMGVAVFDHLPRTLEDALKSADQLMYQSKNAGKSRTTIGYYHE